jgi:hypothetical protein
METIPSSGSSVAQASCYLGYVIAVHRTLLKLGDYLYSTSLSLVSCSLKNVAL